MLYVKNTTFYKQHKYFLLFLVSKLFYKLFVCSSGFLVFQENWIQFSIMFNICFYFCDLVQMNIDIFGMNKKHIFLFFMQGLYVNFPSVKFEVSSGATSPSSSSFLSNSSSLINFKRKNSYDQ